MTVLQNVSRRGSLAAEPAGREGTSRSIPSTLSHNSNGVTILLDPYEIEFAAHVGTRRHCSALQRGLHDAHGVSSADALKWRRQRRSDCTGALR